MAASAPVTQTRSGAADPSVVTDWNATAVATIFTDTAKMPSEGYLYLGFTHAAIYNAVVGITRDYDLVQVASARIRGGPHRKPRQRRLLTGCS